MEPGPKCLNITAPVPFHFSHDIVDMKWCRARVDGLPEDQQLGVAYGNAERIFKL